MIEKIKKTPLYPILAGIYPRIHKIYIWLVWQICYLLPVEHKKIVFSNFNGGGFGDNTRYIAEECIRAGRFLIKCIGSVKSLAAHFRLN